MLKGMNKKTTVEQNTKAFDIARKSGLRVKALMSVGHPGESHETIEETAEWLRQVKPDETDVTIIAEYPGAQYFDCSIWSEKDNAWIYTSPNGEILFSDDVDFLRDNSFYKTSANNYQSHVFTPYMSKEDIVTARNYLDGIGK